MCRSSTKQKNTPPKNKNYIHDQSTTWNVCVHTYGCVCVCVWCLFISLHLLIALITDLSASHSLRRKNKLLEHMKRDTHTHTHIYTHTHTHTHLSQLQSVCKLFDSVPAGDLSFIVSSPWSLVPFCSSAGAEHLSLCLRLCLFCSGCRWESLICNQPLSPHITVSLFK